MLTTIEVAPEVKAQLAVNGGQWPTHSKPVTAEERAKVLALIEALDNSLDLEPAFNETELIAAANALTFIKSESDRKHAGELRAKIVAAKKLVNDCFEDGIKRAHARHKMKTVKRADYLLPLDCALADVDVIIRDDIETQRHAAEEEQRRKQAEADAKARAEQEARQKEADRLLAIEREARQKAEREAQEARKRAAEEIAVARASAEKARSQAAKERAEAELKAAQERQKREQEAAKQAAIDAAAREAYAKANVAEVKAAPVQATVIERKEIARVEGIRFIKPKYKGRVIDKKLLPLEYLEVDQGKIDKVCQALGTETRIPGVEVYQEAASVATKGN